MISVLIVDDQPAFLELARDILCKDVAVEVCTSDSAEKAIEMLKNKRVDIVVSDYRMQGMDGLEFLRTLRSRGNSTPFILYASKGKENVAIEAVKGGADFFLQKSDDIRSQFTELKYVIEEIVKRKKTEETLLRRERDFRAIVEKNADAMIVLDRNGVILYVNPAGIALFAMPEDELIGNLLGFPIVLTEPVGMYILRGFKEFVAVEMRMVEVEWNDEPSYLLSFRDVTGHIQYEEELSKARDLLEQRVEERTSELSITNEELRNEVSQRAMVEEQLEEAKSQAELYLDLMGHDINNLNQIGIGYLEMAQEASSLDEMKALIAKPLDVMKSASQIIQNVRKLQQLAKDEEKTDLATRVMDLCDLLSEMQKRYTHTSGRAVTINFEPIPNCFILANDLIKDVFSNLIENAIKHSDPDKPLVIHVNLNRIKEKGQEYYRCSIEDNGPGIPDWLKDKLFMRFQRGATKAHGKGLGLYLVKRLVKDFLGTVWIEDRVPGDYTKGAKFVVTLPVA